MIALMVASKSVELGIEEVRSIEAMFANACLTVPDSGTSDSFGYRLGFADSPSAREATRSAR